MDSLITHSRCPAGDAQRPFRLSLCGATALTHDAVSALLRLPLLSELKIDGCFRINSMDKMRLVAKVKAGASGAAALPSLRGGSAKTGNNGRCAPADLRALGSRMLRAHA